MPSGQTLFSPLQLGSLSLPNRIVMAPMTRNRAGKDNAPQQLNAEYYAQRASAGLIITEACQISAQGIGYPSTPGIHYPIQVTGWRRVTEAVRKNKGRIFLQLWHVGRISHPSMQSNDALPVAPSAIKPAGECITYHGAQAFVTPRALETEEIPAIVAQYRRAAFNAMIAGFDGIEIHAANGYLLDQFLRDYTNHRQDRYGGSLYNRTRLLSEVIAAVLEIWEPGRVGVRISPENSFNDIHDSNPQSTFNFITGRLNRYGLAYLHVVEGDMLNGLRTLEYSQIRKRFNGKYMSNGGYTQETAEDSLHHGRADLVSFGSLYISNPDLVERFEKGIALNNPDPTTFYGGGTQDYTDYPFREGQQRSMS